MTASPAGTTVVAISHHKGGSSKTALTVGLAAHLAQREPVLVIDADSQANLTSRLGQDPEEPDSDPRDLPGLGEVLVGTPATDVIVGTTWDRLDLLPAGALLGIDTHLDRVPVGQATLRRALEPVVASGAYSWILIDTKPAQSTSVQAALVAADLVVAPCPVLSKDAVDGVADLTALLGVIEQSGLPVGAFTGVVATRHKDTLKGNAALQAVGEWYPVLGTVKERPVWVDAEALRVPVQELAKKGTKQGDEIRAEMAGIAKRLRAVAKKKGRK